MNRPYGQFNNYVPYWLDFDDFGGFGRWSGVASNVVYTTFQPCISKTMNSPRPLRYRTQTSPESKCMLSGRHLVRSLRGRGDFDVFEIWLSRGIVNRKS